LAPKAEEVEQEAGAEELALAQAQVLGFLRGEAELREAVGLGWVGALGQEADEGPELERTRGWERVLELERELVARKVGVEPAPSQQTMRYARSCGR